MGEQRRWFCCWLNHSKNWSSTMCIFGSICWSLIIPTRFSWTRIVCNINEKFIQANSDCNRKRRSGALHKEIIFQELKRNHYVITWIISSKSVIACALASLIPLVTRSFQADRIVTICLIICYLVTLTVSLLTGLEFLWPPPRK